MGEGCSRKMWGVEKFGTSGEALRAEGGGVVTTERSRKYEQVRDREGDEAFHERQRGEM